MSDLNSAYPNICVYIHIYKILFFQAMQRICNTLFSEAELEGNAVQPLTRDMNTVSGPLYALVTTKYFSTGPSSEIKHVKQIVVPLD